MKSDATPPTSLPSRRAKVGGQFLTTRWTQVSHAKKDSPEGRRALADLCAAYYEPVAEFLRSELRDGDAARDVAHDFFAATLRGGAIIRAEQERGRFRSYLLGAVKHFLSHHREAARRLKRGGGVESFSLNDTGADEVRSLSNGRELTPDKAFDRQWALTALARSLDGLRGECEAGGNGELFAQVKPWLTGDAAHGDQTAVAAACGMNANALKVAVHRMKRRFRELLKSEVTSTLDDPGGVESEMQALFAALRG